MVCAKLPRPSGRTSSYRSAISDSAAIPSRDCRSVTAMFERVQIVVDTRAQVPADEHEDAAIAHDVATPFVLDLAQYAALWCRLAFIKPVSLRLDQRAAHRARTKALHRDGRVSTIDADYAAARPFVRVGAAGNQQEQNHESERGFFQRAGDSFQRVGESFHSVRESLQSVRDSLQSVRDSLQSVRDSLQSVRDSLQSVRDFLQRGDRDFFHSPGDVVSELALPGDPQACGRRTDCAIAFCIVQRDNSLALRRTFVDGGFAQAPEPAAHNPECAEADDAEAVTPRAAPEWNEPTEPCSLHSACHEAPNVSAERRVSIRFEIAPPDQDVANSNRGYEADNECSAERVVPEQDRRHHRGANIGEQLDWMYLVVEDSFASLHARSAAMSVRICEAEVEFIE